MKEIRLTQGFVAFIDDDDFDNCSQYNWAAEVRKNTVYASASLGSRGNRIRLHRFVMNAQQDQQVDHKDRDGLNCQKDNLRFADHQCNGRNIIQPQSLNGSGYRGVYKHHTSDRWIARIRDTEGKKRHLGMHGTKEEAAKIYDEFAKMYHGEFAVLNFAL